MNLTLTLTLTQTLIDFKELDGLNMDEDKMRFEFRGICSNENYKKYALHVQVLCTNPKPKPKRNPNSTLRYSARKCSISMDFSVWLEALGTALSHPPGIFLH